MFFAKGESCGTEDLARLHESLGNGCEELSSDFTSLATLRALAIRRHDFLRPSMNHEPMMGSY
jgi:hypothetical protein